MQHLTLYQQPLRYAGWPANYGIWNWGTAADDEIVVGFISGYFDVSGGFHARDRSRPFETLQARSLDGGLSWQIDPFPGPTPGGRALSADEHMREDLGIAAILSQPNVQNPLRPCPGQIDFTHPDFALMCARTGLEAGAVSWFYLSDNRARTWQGPYALPDFGLPGISARTDVIVLGPAHLLLMLTAAKSNGKEGRVFCAETRDGGRSFEFVAWVTPEPEGFAIMPSTVRLPDGRLLCAVRYAPPKQGPQYEDCWIDLFRSDDTGASWHFVTQITTTGSFGNPPAMLQLHDGRLCITYGYRSPPYGMRARLSQDDGQTWSDEIILRADAGNADLGYPRTVQRADGMLVTVYYYNEDENRERIIAATLWHAPDFIDPKPDQDK